MFLNTYIVFCALYRTARGKTVLRKSEYPKLQAVQIIINGKYNNEHILLVHKCNYINILYISCTGHCE